MKPKLPLSLKVGYQTIQIRPKSAPGGSRQNIGAYNAQQSVIEAVTEDQTGAMLVNTILHETLHAIVHNYGPVDFHGSASEEPVINQMTNGLVQVIRDNPELLTWVQAELARD